MIEFVGQATTVVAWICGILLFIDLALTVIKLVRGPSVLNRALASDLLVSTLICAIGIEMVVRKHDSTLPILITLSLLAFIGTVAVARFVARDSDDDGAAARAREHKLKQQRAQRAQEKRDLDASLERDQQTGRSA
jgi:multicomponent Na+:H+ antiporter subunit F